MSDTGSSGQGAEDRPGPGSPEHGPAGGTPPPPPPSDTGGAPPPPPPPPPAAEVGDRTGQAADIGVRIGARLIDHILLAIVAIFLTGFLVADAGGTNAFAAATSMTAWLATLVSTAIYIAYFAYLESSRGQTLGKQLLNIRVIGPDGGNPTLEQGIKRNLWIAAGLIPFIGGFVELGLVIWIIITITNSAEKRGVHDQWGDGTQVVRV